MDKIRKYIRNLFSVCNPQNTQLHTENKFRMRCPSWYIVVHWFRKKLKKYPVTNYLVSKNKISRDKSDHEKTNKHKNYIKSQEGV